MSSLTTKLAAVAAVIANAATKSNSGSTAAHGAKPHDDDDGHERDRSKGGHQANGETEKLLTGDTAAKVKAAALGKVPGGTVERVENDADSSSPYEAHVRKSDGTAVVVLVNSSFQATSVNEMGHR